MAWFSAPLSFVRASFSLIAVLAMLCQALPALAVMPSAHYRKAVEASRIKAVAEISGVKVIAKTSRSTEKQVFFSLVRAFEPGVPDTFDGICYSVDETDQDPGVGGQLYFYPQQGMQVLVTLSSDHGTITSLTPMNRLLDQLTITGGLSQVEFNMGKANARPEAGTAWYLFSLDGNPSGYLAIREEAAEDPARHRWFYQDFFVRFSDDAQQLFQIHSRAGADPYLSLEWLRINVLRTGGKTVSQAETRELGFRPGQDGVEGGILVRTSDNAADIGLPPGTTSDFLVFSLARDFDPVPGFRMDLNIVETLEVHLKKGIPIAYSGQDSAGRHCYVQGTGEAAYCLNETGRLETVSWDDDKRFVRMTRQQVLDLLLP